MRGEKAKPAILAESDRAIHRERRYGAFCRTIDLPDDINPDKLKAKCHAGVLEITIPKTEANKPKSVKIQVEDEKP
jgi:HSP20 family protein